MHNFDEDDGYGESGEAVEGLGGAADQNPDDSGVDAGEAVKSLTLVSKAEVEKTTRLFSTLTPSDTPLIPLPQDNLSDLQYNHRFEPRCQLCKSFLGERAEHVYLDQGRKPQAVRNFFLKHFNATISWEAVDQHMQQHCYFKHVTQSGLKNYALREEDMNFWKYRELDLAITAIMVELDEVRGMDTSNNAELKIKRAAIVERLVNRLINLKNERDSAGTQSVNIFAVLKEIHDQLPLEARFIVRDKVKELREKLADG
jgi:hypothetical protein